jgi:hypothetical protein
MTTFVQSEEKKVIPFLKLGAFDENNYTPKKLAEVKANEAKYGTLRLAAGDAVEGVISGFYPTANGDVMYLKDVKITRAKDGSFQDGVIEDVGAVKIGLSHDINYKVRTKGNKEVGQSVFIKYKGVEVSPKDATRTLHRVDVA